MQLRLHKNARCPAAGAARPPTAPPLPSQAGTFVGFDKSIDSQIDFIFGAQGAAPTAYGTVPDECERGVCRLRRCQAAPRLHAGPLGTSAASVWTTVSLAHTTHTPLALLKVVCVAPSLHPPPPPRPRPPKNRRPQRPLLLRPPAHHGDTRNPGLPLQPRGAGGQGGGSPGRERGVGGGQRGGGQDQGGGQQGGVGDVAGAAPFVGANRGFCTRRRSGVCRSGRARASHL